MSNPFFKQGAAAPRNPMQMINEFRKFAANMTPERAEQEINQLLSSGKMSKQQFEELKQQAKSFMQFLQ
nr:MAG TPA: hypothetical protein [Caudoviricetes sp.]